MNLNTIFPLPTWLTADEKKRYNKMKRPLLAHARELGIKMDPFLLAQINDYLITEIMLSRAELPLQEPNALPSEKLFKQREKIGKMRQELRAAFDKAAEKMQAFSTLSHPENPVIPVENSPSLPCPPITQALTLPDPSDLSDPSDASDSSDLPQSSPSSLCLGGSVVKSPSLPLSPPITPNTVAAFMSQHKSALEDIRELTAKMQALPAAV